MSIDAVIEAVRREPDKTFLLLKPRVDSKGIKSIPGQRQLYITRNPKYEPQVGDEIWGNAQQVVINSDHSFRRMRKLWDGSFEAL